MGPKQRRVTEAGGKAKQEAACVQARLDRIAEQLEHMQNLQTDEAQVHGHREKMEISQRKWKFIHIGQARLGSSAQ